MASTCYDRSRDTCIAFAALQFSSMIRLVVGVPLLGPRYPQAMLASSRRLEHIDRYRRRQSGSSLHVRLPVLLISGDINEKNSRIPAGDALQDS